MLNNSDFDVFLMAGFGVFDYLCSKLETEPAPMLLGFSIGPMMEEYRYEQRQGTPMLSRLAFDSGY